MQGFLIHSISYFLSRLFSLFEYTTKFSSFLSKYITFFLLLKQIVEVYSCILSWKHNIYILFYMMTLKTEFPFVCSSSAWTHSSITLRYQPNFHGFGWWRWARRTRHGQWLFQWSAGAWAYLTAPESWTLPQQPLWSSVWSTVTWRPWLRHGHRQYLWVGCPTPLQHHWVGPEHSLLSWLTRLGASGPAAPQLEWTVHPECSTIGPASTHGPPAGCRWLPCFPHVCWACGLLHGPGASLPGPGG